MGPVFRSIPTADITLKIATISNIKEVINLWIVLVGYSDYDVFLENDEGSRVYRCKKLF